LVKNTNELSLKKRFRGRQREKKEREKKGGEENW